MRARLFACCALACAACLDFTNGTRCNTSRDCFGDDYCIAGVCTPRDGAVVAVHISPKQATTVVNQPFQLSATVSGVSEQAVKWATTDPFTEINQSGQITPHEAGMVHVTATSLADLEQSDEAVVTVTAQ
jgi:hypothetical protein